MQQAAWVVKLMTETELVHKEPAPDFDSIALGCRLRRLPLRSQKITNFSSFPLTAYSLVTDMDVHIQARPTPQQLLLQLQHLAVAYRQRRCRLQCAA